MQAVVNGQTRPIDEGQTLGTLLQALGLDPGQVVVEHNGHIVEKHEILTTHIETGDQIEIVRLVGGG